MFTWSLPFLADKVVDMFDMMLAKTAELDIKTVKEAAANEVKFETIMNQLKEEKKEESKAKLARIKQKIMTVARMNRMFKNLKTNSQAITRAKMISPDGKLPMGLLLKSHDEVKSELNMYLKVKNLD